MARMRKHREACTGFFFIFPSLSGIVIFFVIPFVKSLYYTFTQGITNVKFVWFANFTDLFINPSFKLAMKNTAVFMVVGIPLVLLLSLLLSLSMMDSRMNVLRGGILMPLIVPISAVVSGWRFLLSEQGLLSSLLSSIGLGAVDFLAESNAMQVALLLYVWKNIGYLSIILSSAIITIPQEHYDVFNLECGSKAKQAWYVIFPQIFPMLFFAFVIATMNTFKAFREIYVMFGAMPPKGMYMLQHFMNNNFFKLNYQRLATAAFMLTCALSFFILLFLRAQNRFHREIQGGD